MMLNLWITTKKFSGGDTFHDLHDLTWRRFRLPSDNHMNMVVRYLQLHHFNTVVVPNFLYNSFERPSIRLTKYFNGDT